MLVSSCVHNFVQFQVWALCKDRISSREVTMTEWERSPDVTVWFRVRILLVSLVWFEFLPFRVAWASDLFACATAIGQPSRLWVLLFHSRALKCFKPGSSLSSVLLTANIQRSWSQTSRHTTQRSVTLVPAVTHPRRVHDCHDSSTTWVTWLPWVVPSWLIRVSIRVGPGFWLGVVHECTGSTWEEMSTWVFMSDSAPAIWNYFLKGKWTIL